MDQIFMPEDALIAERDRLVRLCLYLAGDPDAAEDLAQEVLIEAWRLAATLREPDKRTQWRSGIARNVCKRYTRTRSREAARLVQLSIDEIDGLSCPALVLADTRDVGSALERHELAALLDKAMALLPQETRDTLIQKYIHNLSYARIASRLEVSEGAVMVRAHRGKQALRRVLATSLRQEAAAYGLTDADDRAWEPTHIWCPWCGQGRMLGLRDEEAGAFAVRCPRCQGDLNSRGAEMRAVLRAVKGYKYALARMEEHSQVWYRGALATGYALCPRCGRSIPIHMSLPAHATGTERKRWGMHLRCDCGSLSQTSLTALVLGTLQVQRFWRAHPRMRVLPDREIEADGMAAVVTAFESLQETARIEVVSNRQSFEVLAIHGETA